MGKVDFLILDKISLIGQYLFNKIISFLFQYGKSTFKIIFVGDFEQLEGVGEPSALFSIMYEPFEILELTENILLDERIKAALNFIRNSNFVLFNELILSRTFNSGFAHKADASSYNRDILKTISMANSAIVYEFVSVQQIPAHIQKQFRFPGQLEMRWVQSDASCQYECGKQFSEWNYWHCAGGRI